jgi:predicted dehydrogenase
MPEGHNDTERGESAMTKRLKVGIVSAAWGAHAHLPAWRSLEDVEVVGICTSRQETAEAAAKTFEVERPYWSVADMAASDLDIIDVGTRPNLREGMVLTALQGGKHVYAGVPFATGPARAREMYETQRDAKLVGIVDAYIQALPAVVRLKEMLAEGAIGEVQSVRARFDLSLFSPRWIGVPTYAWFADAANGASSLRNLGSHALHTLVSLFGPIERATGMADLRLKAWPAADGSIIQPQTDDTTMALLRFSSGVMGHLYTGWVAVEGQGFQLEVQGSEGRLVVEAPPMFPESYTATLTYAPLGAAYERTAQLVEIPERLKQVRGSSLHGDTQRNSVFSMARLFRGMVDAIRTGDPTAAQPDFRQAAHVQAAIDAVLRGSAAETWEGVPEL